MATAPLRPCPTRTPVSSAPAATCRPDPRSSRKRVWISYPHTTAKTQAVRRSMGPPNGSNSHESWAGGPLPSTDAAAWESPSNLPRTTRAVQCSMRRVVVTRGSGTRFSCVWMDPLGSPVDHQVEWDGRRVLCFRGGPVWDEEVQHRARLSPRGGLRDPGTPCTSKGRHPTPGLRTTESGRPVSSTRFLPIRPSGRLSTRTRSK